MYLFLQSLLPYRYFIFLPPPPLPLSQSLKTLLYSPKAIQFSALEYQPTQPNNCLVAG